MCVQQHTCSRLLATTAEPSSSSREPPVQESQEQLTPAIRSSIKLSAETLIRVQYHRKGFTTGQVDFKFRKLWKSLEECRLENDLTQKLFLELKDKDLKRRLAENLHCLADSDDNNGSPSVRCRPAKRSRSGSSSSPSSNSE